MGSVGTPVIRRIAQVSRGPISAQELLEGVGLTADPGPAPWKGESVDEDVYYDLLERAVGEHDDGLPFRYADALRTDDLGALGLALKTAPSVRDALSRLVRYILVLSDTLDYEFLAAPEGEVFALRGRPHHRRGAALANECALAATTAVLRRITGAGITPREATFAHHRPASDRAHRDFFGCPVVFGAPVNGIVLDTADLRRPTLLADEGLSDYLLAQLDDLWSRSSERSVVADVRGAVADSLPDGLPSRSQVARRLGMSERTLQRRLSDEGQTFQAVATDARRLAAESLLASGTRGLADVAFLTGFSDQTAFTRAFKRWTGQTPASFRADGSTSRRA